MRVKSVGIVGGGTGGLVTAMILKSYFPFIKVDIIESKAIGIVGVGEGSTEHWSKFMRQCGIGLHELVKETGATFKYGINFANWNGDNRSYIQSVNAEMNQSGPTGIKLIYANLISKNVDPLHLTRPYVVKSELREDNYNINQFHFDTFKLNEFLHKKSLAAGINIIDAEIENINLDENGFIQSLVSKDGRTFSYDFYVDSTGFARIIMNKTFGIKWKSYSKYLPTNCAFAFPTERLEEIPAWTLSRAMKHGWLWRIPTQDRFGNGYVYNDQFTTFEEAKAEVEELYGHSIDVARSFKFDAGCLEKQWHKNCCAIGLSSSFVEPLEASSIGTSIQQAFVLGEVLPSYVPGSTLAEKTFDRHSSEILENIVDFVALHYKTKRTNTEFWKYAKNMPMTDRLAEMLEIYQYKFPTDYDFDNKRVLFQAANWILVMYGLGMLNPTVADDELLKLPELLRKNVDIHTPGFFNDLEGIKFISHREAINKLLNS